jgi:hypothetical protein
MLIRQEEMSRSHEEMTRSHEEMSKRLMRLEMDKLNEDSREKVA